MTNNKNTVLYTGVTSDLKGRVYEHREKLVGGFTKRYDVTKLVYYEAFEGVVDAIAREKQIKGWERKWKIRVIEQVNPQWDDLYNEICGFPPENCGNDGHQGYEPK